MTNSFSIVWAPANVTAICATQVALQNEPMTFVNPISSQNIFTGQNPVHAQLPVGTARSLAIENQSGAATVTLEVEGLDPFGNSLSESITVAASTTADTVNFYSIVNSITSTTLPDVDVSVGYGASGYIIPPVFDVWNKSSSYTISLNSVIGGSDVDVSILYSNTPVNTFINGQLIPTTFFEPGGVGVDVYTLPVANTNVIIDSSATISSLPVTLTDGEFAAFSIIGIPLTTLFAEVVSGTNGFTVTINQQGGRF